MSVSTDIRSKAPPNVTPSLLVLAPHSSMPLVMSTHYWVLMRCNLDGDALLGVACIQSGRGPLRSRSSLAVQIQSWMCVLFALVERTSQPGISLVWKRLISRSASFSLRPLALAPIYFACYDCFCIGLGSFLALLLAVVDAIEGMAFFPRRDGDCLFFF
jgi:hypothetical protein